MIQLVRLKRAYQFPEFTTMLEKKIPPPPPLPAPAPDLVRSQDDGWAPRTSIVEAVGGHVHVVAVEAEDAAELGDQRGLGLAESNAAQVALVAEVALRDKTMTKSIVRHQIRSREPEQTT